MGTINSTIVYGVYLQSHGTNELVFEARQHCAKSVTVAQLKRAWHSLVAQLAQLDFLCALASSAGA
jgi:hypothetical protein